MTAAGGITTWEEIDALDAAGVDAVVGMAIYTGQLPLERRYAAGCEPLAYVTRVTLTTVTITSVNVTPMQNPFVYGEVVPGDAFADREAELDRLVDDLGAGQKVFLISPRRYGKSSLSGRR